MTHPAARSALLRLPRRLIVRSWERVVLTVTAVAEFAGLLVAADRGLDLSTRLTLGILVLLTTYTLVFRTYRRPAGRGEVSR